MANRKGQIDPADLTIEDVMEFPATQRLTWIAAAIGSASIIGAFIVGFGIGNGTAPSPHAQKAAQVQPEQPQTPQTPEQIAAAHCRDLLDQEVSFERSIAQNTLELAFLEKYGAKDHRYTSGEEDNEAEGYKRNVRNFRQEYNERVAKYNTDFALYSASCQALNAAATPTNATTGTTPTPTVGATEASNAAARAALAHPACQIGPRAYITQ